MTKQGTVDINGLTTGQLQFTISVMAMVLDKLIQDELVRDENGDPLPADQQESDLTRQVMQILNYK